MLEHVVYSIDTTTSYLANIVLRNLGYAKLDDEHIPEQLHYFLFRCRHFLFCQFLLQLFDAIER